MTTYVLKPQTVRQAIEDLHSRKIHPHFPTYLGLVRFANRRDTKYDLNYPYADYLKENYVVKASSNQNMVVDDKEKPFLTPFTKNEPLWKGDNWDQQVSPRTAGRAAANQGLHKVVDIDEDAGTYTLLESHIEKAMDFLTFGERVPAIPVAVFLYRDDGFVVDGDEDRPTLDDLEEIFRGEYGFDDDDDFNTLFIPGYDIEVSEPFQEYND